MGPCDAAWRDSVQNPHQRLRMGQPLHYRIEVQGRIDERWLEWFEGMDIEVADAEHEPVVTSLTGILADQAALLGVLRKLYDRGYLLLGVNCLGLDREGAV